MLERFFEAKSFRFHVPKVIQVPTIIFVEYFGWKSCIYYMYALYERLFLDSDIKPTGIGTAQYQATIVSVAIMRC